MSEEEKIKLEKIQKRRSQIKPITGPNDPRVLLRKQLAETKKKDLKNMLEIELNKSINGVTRMEGLIARMVSEGIRGNMRAIELILAYIYGKPQNAVQQNNDKPFVLELTEGDSKALVKGDAIPNIIEIEEEEDEAD
jgi:hypothetical protein